MPAGKLKFMELKRKPAALVVAVIVIGWQAVGQPLWNLNVERWAEQRNLDTTLTNGHTSMSALWGFFDYIPSSFSLGFAIGGLLFAYWDAIVLAFRRHILRHAPKAADAPEPKVWAGDITAVFDQKEPSRARVIIRALNWGQVPFTLSAFRGHMTMTHDNGSGRKTITKLEPPTIDPETWGQLVEPGYILFLDLTQHIPRNITRMLPDMFSWGVRTYINFDALEIEVTSPDGKSKTMKLCDCIRLTTGDWEVRSSQCTRMFKSDEEAAKFKEDMRAASAILGDLGR